MKLEGGRSIAPTIKALVDAEIPAMAHIGLRPQAIRRLGGYKVQRSSDELLADAHAVAEAGTSASCSSASPRARRRDHRRVADPHNRHRSRPPLRWAGPRAPRLARPSRRLSPAQIREAICRLGRRIRAAAARYVADVSAGQYPSDRESFR